MFTNPEFLRQMLLNATVTGLDVDHIFSYSCTCNDCMLGKMHRIPWPGTPKSVHDHMLPGEMIVVDGWGPAPVRTPNGSRFATTITDVASKYSTGFVHRKKNDFKRLFVDHFQLIKTQTGRSLKRAHFDLAGEYVDGDLVSFLKDNGVIISYSAARAKEQNGIAERKNRTHFNKALAAIHDSNLALTYWGEAFLAAIYVSNRMYSSSLPAGLSPYEVFFGVKPDVRHLRRIGCLAFVFLEKEQRATKLSPKAVVCTLVGYSSMSSSYRLVDIHTGKFYESRQVVFREDQTSKNSSSSSAVITHQDFDNDLADLIRNFEPIHEVASIDEIAPIGDDNYFSVLEDESAPLSPVGIQELDPVELPSMSFPELVLDTPVSPVSTIPLVEFNDESPGTPTPLAVFEDPPIQLLDADLSTNPFLGVPPSDLLPRTLSYESLSDTDSESEVIAASADRLIDKYTPQASKFWTYATDELPDSPTPVGHALNPVTRDQELPQGISAPPVNPTRRPAKPTALSVLGHVESSPILSLTTQQIPELPLDSYLVEDILLPYYTKPA